MPHLTSSHLQLEDGVPHTEKGSRNHTGYPAPSFLSLKVRAVIDFFVPRLPQSLTG